MGLVQDLCSCTDREDARRKNTEHPMKRGEKQQMMKSDDKAVYQDKKHKMMVSKEPAVTPKKRGLATSKYEYNNDMKEPKQKPPQISKLRITTTDVHNIENEVGEIQTLPNASPIIIPNDSIYTTYMKQQINATQKRASLKKRDSLSWINGLYEKNYAEGMNNWNKQSLEWFNRMQELYEFIKKMKPTTRSYVWWSFDKQRANKLGSKLFIPKLIYSYIVLLMKAIDKRSIPPKYKQLRSVLVFYTMEMIQLMPIAQKEEITKTHYDLCFILYLENIMDKRSHLIPQ